ncbi:MAG: Holliday junction DNA helicase RuvB C-terminal domain-containing protein [Mariprofundaceae bacterium]|nr:Holliday junction DNA helicase RuvB C-terminal domain-containing protein [Mariprofundaceae bacterium]
MTNQVRLNDLIGLFREKSKALTLIRACRNSGFIFPHTLLHGIGGTGKTALARAIGTELGYHFVEVESIIFRNRDQLLQFLFESSSFANKSGHSLLLFIDEIHRLKLSLQESLYLPMKEWRITSHQGDIKISPFTLFGATTRFDMLDSNSFVTRFDNQWEIERYSLTDIGLIIAQSFRHYHIRFNRDVVDEIAQRCLGIPRIAISFVKKVMMFALSVSTNHITLSHVHHMFKLEQIDSFGLHPIHRRYLEFLSKSSPHPLGVGSISSKMRQPEDVVKGVIEPILLEMDFIASTPRGRVLTEEGRTYLFSEHK